LIRSGQKIVILKKTTQRLILLATPSVPRDIAFLKPLALERQEKIPDSSSDSGDSTDLSF
jgi:hypothetical protein